MGPLKRHWLLSKAHTTSSGVTIRHKDNGGVIITASGRAVHLTDTQWRELIQYEVARINLEMELQ